jgi:hypothetical protein
LPVGCTPEKTRVIALFAFSFCLFHRGRRRMSCHALEHFRAKWNPVGVKKTRQIKIIAPLLIQSGAKMI